MHILIGKYFYTYLLSTMCGAQQSVECVVQTLDLRGIALVVTGIDVALSQPSMQSRT